jgi:hypothetical protein
MVGPAAAPLLGLVFNFKKKINKKKIKKNL